MTDIGKVQSYYNSFNEWERLESGEGRLEFEIVMSLLCRYIPENSTLLDLGGGPGRYTAELSKVGYKVFLADLSPVLIETAREKIGQFGSPGNVLGMDVCNALDLSLYEDNQFDALLLFGPLYHLTTEEEILKCVSEAGRVIAEGGLIFATYLPYLSGLSGVLDRAFYAPSHVDPVNLLGTFEEGVFHNKSAGGFQEGAFLRTQKLEEYFSHGGFEKRLLRSIRSIGYMRADHILPLREKDRDYYQTIMEILHGVSGEPSVVDSCGHAIYIGQKTGRKVVP